MLIHVLIYTGHIASTTTIMLFGPLWLKLMAR
jgi:hypothetical protein